MFPMQIDVFFELITLSLILLEPGTFIAILGFLSHLSLLIVALLPVREELVELVVIATFVDVFNPLHLHIDVIDVVALSLQRLLNILCFVISALLHLGPCIVAHIDSSHLMHLVVLLLIVCEVIDYILIKK